MFVYAGCYTLPPAGSGAAKGISVYRFDPDSGAMTHIHTSVGIPNPSFLAMDSRQRFLFAVNEQDDGFVSAFARDPDTGKLRFLNRQSAHGMWPCYISLDSSDRFALVANYGSGTVAALPIGDDGRLSQASSVIQHAGSSVHLRQGGPHAHMIAPAPGGKFLLATDLGTDQVIAYRLDTATGELKADGATDVEPGAGPRHFAFSPDGKRLYVLNEIASSMTVYDYDKETGTMAPRQTVSSLPADFTGENSCAHILVSPGGRFVYGSNRGHDSIAIWAVDEPSGEISLAGHESTQGRVPRNFAIDPTGKWLLAANQESDTIVTFRRDPETGMLSPTGQVTQTANPVAILFSRA